MAPQRLPRLVLAAVLLLTSTLAVSHADETRLLRQPTLSADHVAFAHGGDLWIVARSGGEARRLTSTPALESNPHISPDGKWIAFSSDRSGVDAVYVTPVAGGTPTRLTWYPAGSMARGWTPDGTRVLYASTRATAPSRYNRLWTVPATGGPSTLLPAPWGNDAAFFADGGKLVIDRVRRWDSEWRHYRGGQNTPLTILDLDSLDETRLPNAARYSDIQPVWMGGTIYFLSDRDWSMNIFAYDPETAALTQLTDFDDVDIKWLDGRGGTLVFERDGYLHTMDVASRAINRLSITLVGDFPWAETRWEDVSDSTAGPGCRPPASGRCSRRGARSSACPSRRATRAT